MAGSTTLHPELTAEQVQKILVEPLEAASVFLASGPRVFDTAGGNQIRIPKLTGTTDPSWHGENEQIDEVDVDFGELILLPSTIKSLKTLTRYSNELARQSLLSLDSILKDRLVKDVAAKLDHQLFAGTGDVVGGHRTTPIGLLNYEDVQEIDSVGAIGFDVLLDAWGKLLAANVNTAAAKWFVRPETFVALRKIKDKQDRYQLQPDPTQDGVFRLFGTPVVVTDRIPKTTGENPTTQAVLADFSQIAVARDQEPAVKILDQTFGDYDQQAIRVTARYDAAPLNPEAIVRLDGITVA
ncbi:phage major capsid protein [Pseudoclavibacter sp. CFCC 13611]|uniref:phage major capsid protein n=1 Tax=Pseudoclavibacter sp. CFCC 13611 TaxID=2615178 RepID=UPI0013017DD8|nr:phage major capsid protein [Pseudoclavibacter sp. CFCC 13611]KAB1662824.1 phage major capsid protein [Pseudoclavibacter sp. CFCC 13611]